MTAVWLMAEFIESTDYKNTTDSTYSELLHVMEFPKELLTNYSTFSFARHVLCVILQIRYS